MKETSPLIVLQNVGVAFKRGKSLREGSAFEALKDVSFSINSGDSLGIIGRNGAGKTTLLRLLAGIYKPDRGMIIKQDIRTALLALQIGFDGELSGRVNAILSGMLLGFVKNEVESKLDRIIEFAELGSFIDQPVKTYSAGMRARLGFSVALELNPDVLLIDEVLGVGDAEFRKKSIAVMHEKLLSDQTIVLVSHDANTVKRLCNRAVWIEDGVTKMDGNSAEVVDAYEKYLVVKTE